MPLEIAEITKRKEETLYVRKSSSEVREEIVKFLTANRTNGYTAVEITDDLKRNRSYIQKILNVLVEENVVSSKGSYYFLTG